MRISWFGMLRVVICSRLRVEFFVSVRIARLHGMLVMNVNGATRRGGMKMKRLLWLARGLFLGSLSASLVVGCSDGTSDTTSSSSSTSSGQTPWVPVKLVINEMHAVTEDWVEILNVDTVEGDLSNVGLTDKAVDGTPQLTDVMRFPEGTKLGPGEYVLIVANLKTAMPGVQTTCLMTGGPATCYQASWGISSANGDRVYLLSPTDEIVDAATYGVNAVPDTQSVCRLPDGTGDFVPCAPTPGVVNAGP